KQAWGLELRTSLLALGIVGEPGLNLSPQIAGDDGFVFALVDLAAVMDLAEVKRVGEGFVDLSPTTGAAAHLSARQGRTLRDLRSFRFQPFGNQPDIADSEISAEQLADEVSMLRHNFEATTLWPVSQRRIAAHPHALGL